MIRAGDIFADDYGDDYEVGKFLGQGGFGVVHLISRLSDGCQFVAKAPLNTDKVKLKKLENEYGVLKKLEEKGVSNVVRAEALVYFQINSGKIPILVMQIAQGVELVNHLNEQISPVDVREILLKISRSMAEVHKAGYIHRDLKPENIFIDFGIAAIKDNENTYAITQSVAYSKFWCPPEQRDGTVSIGNDIFSLGAVGYALLIPGTELKRVMPPHGSIEPPYDPKYTFETNTMEDKHLYEVIKKATSYNRYHRFGTMEDMANHLDGAPPSENFPRIIADGHSHPLIPGKSKWTLGRNWHPPQSEILINETTPGGVAISRQQAYIERTGDCSFKLHHIGMNDTRIGIQKRVDSKITTQWKKVPENGYPLGPHHVLVCFGFSETPPPEYPDMPPGPYKVFEYFPPQDAVAHSGQSTM